MITFIFKNGAKSTVLFLTCCASSRLALEPSPHIIEFRRCCKSKSKSKSKNKNKSKSKSKRKRKRKRKRKSKERWSLFWVLSFPTFVCPWPVLASDRLSQGTC